jgi:Na+-transporting methylmalonyl-CoA/oxaloacetate decarboxylase gamma subunit
LSEIWKIEVQTAPLPTPQSGHGWRSSARVSRPSDSGRWFMPPFISAIGSQEQKKEGRRTCMTQKELDRYNRPANQSSFQGCGVVLLALVIMAGVVFGVFAIYRHSVNYNKNKENEELAKRDAQQARKMSDQQTEQRRLHKPIVIKGLYIGMDSQDVPSAVAQKFGAGWKLNKVGQGYNVTTAGLEKLADMYINGEIGKPENYKFDSWVEVHVDGDDKVSGIVIGHNCSLELFGNPNLTQQEYARMLCNAYHIPTLTGERGGWSYTSPDNVQIKVTDEREIEIWKGADVKDAQKAFN